MPKEKKRYHGYSNYNQQEQHVLACSWKNNSMYSERDIEPELPSYMAIPVGAIFLFFKQMELHHVMKTLATE
jgi:hypothetical protein